MKTRLLKVIIFLILAGTFTNEKLIAQPGMMTLTFSADNNGQTVTLDSILIKNITRNCDTALYSPDFTLVIDTLATGISERFNGENGFSLCQNYPNPFLDETNFEVFIPEKETVEIKITNILGQAIIATTYQMEAGLNRFIFTSGSEQFYLLSVTCKNVTRSIRMLASGDGNVRQCKIKFMGNSETDVLKSTLLEAKFEFEPGDEMLFTGYALQDESGIVHNPETSRNYEFQFESNITCTGLDSLLWGGKYYHTVQIYSQCWMKENLDAGMMINGTQTPSDNGIVEKYCYGNNQNNCFQKGGLYLWEELMGYSTVNGAQGICPQGWHIPADEEWKVLEGIADSHYGIGNPVWNGTEFRGLNAGKNLKSATGWSSNGNGTDLYGFAAISGGYWWQNAFYDNSNFGIYWTSTLGNLSLPYYRGMRMDMNGI